MFAARLTRFMSDWALIRSSKRTGSPDTRGHDVLTLIAMLAPNAAPAPVRPIR
jgi:hypothetical protein